MNTQKNLDKMLKEKEKNQTSFTKDKVIRFFRDRNFLKHKYFFLAVAAAIFFIAIFARTYHLSSLPPGVYPDEAVNGTDALNALKTGHFQLFYSNNYGREGLFMNLIALGFMVFGVSVITLKMWAVFFGVLTIAGIMLLALELFGSYRAGLVAGFLYATSFWAINFSRISFRANMLPFVLVFSFYFLFKGLRTKKFADYIWAGVFFGLGMHGYIAFRVAPAILIAILIAFLVSKKNFLRDYWKPILTFFLAAFFVALPMLLTFFFHPEYFETRSESVSVFSPKVNQGHLAAALTDSISKTFGMFNLKGDQNWRHNFPSQPEMQSFSGIFFLIGVAVLLFQIFYWLYQRIRRKKQSDDFVVTILLFSWLLVMLLPGILSYEGVPHAIRTIGALPAAILIATFAVEKIFNLAGKLARKKNMLFQTSGVISQLALIILVIWSGVFSLKTYFIDWAGAPQIHAAFSRNFKNIALYINNLPTGVNKYVIANAGGQIMDDGLPVSTEVVKLLTYSRSPGVVFVRPGFDPKLINSPAKVVLMYYDGEFIAQVKALHPGAKVQKIDANPGNGTDFFVINIY